MGNPFSVGQMMSIIGIDQNASFGGIANAMGLKCRSS